MRALFKNLEWEKGTVKIEPRYRYSYIPENAVEGANGTLIIPNPAKLYLTLITEDGRIIKLDIVNVVKNINGWQKISNKRFNILKSRLQNERFEVDQYDNVSNLGGLVLF